MQSPSMSGTVGLRANHVELSREQYKAIVDLTTAVGKLIREDKLPAVLREPFMGLLAAFRIS